MADNEKKITPEEAQDIFARQLKKFELTEEEQARAEKLGLNDIDLSEMDLFEEKTPFEVVDSLSLEECAQLNGGSGYYDKVVCNGFTKYELAAYCLEEIYRHIETGEISQQMMDINEKLLCFAEGDDLINAITCMGLQLAKFNRNNNEVSFDNQPGETGLMLNFYHNLARTVTDWKSMDADTQMTLATEAHLIEDEANIIENITYIYSGIIERLNKAENYVPSDPEKIFRPQLSEITVNVVKMHYEYIYSAYEKVNQQIEHFVFKLIDDKINLDNGGKYNSDLSVFRLAKMKAFGNADYLLSGDERRKFVYEKPKADKPKTETKTVQKTTYGKGNKKQTKARKLAEKRAAKYGKTDSVIEDKDKESSAIQKTSASKKNTASAVKKQPSVPQEAKDAKAEYLTFFRKVNSLTDAHKRKIMIDTCKEQLKEKPDNIDETIDYAEKLLALDSENENFIEIYDDLLVDDLSVRLIFKAANFEESFKGTLNKKLQYIKEIKSEIPNKPGIANSPILPKAGLLLTVALFIGALMIPITFIQSVIGALVKIIVVLLGLGLLLTTGPGVVLFLPLFIFIALTVFNMIGTFINPFLLLKILIVGIIGAFAVYQAREISYDIRRLQLKYDKCISTKKECLSIAEKLLAICKERNMPNEMVTYYERMVAEFKKI